MADDRRFLVNVGMRDLPLPMRVVSRSDPGGQHTIANISISARIMQEFEARWIDKFIRIVHAHRDRIGTETLRVNIMDYLTDLNASMVRVDFDYPIFMDRVAPVSEAKCLVRYLCRYSARVLSVDRQPKVLSSVDVPCITTYPASVPQQAGGLFGQLSVVTVEVQSDKDVYPEDIVELVDGHALSPVYSFLTAEDQAAIIQKVHTQTKTSVTLCGEVKDELARDRDIGWYSVHCANFGMLHSYSTLIGTEKSMWVPFSGYQE